MNYSFNELFDKNIINLFVQNVKYTLLNNKCFEKKQLTELAE